METELMKWARSNNYNDLYEMLKQFNTNQQEQIKENEQQLIFKLFKLINDDEIKQCEKFIDEYPNLINCRNMANETPLIHACIKGKYHIAKYLVQRHANIEVVDNKGYNALMYACCGKCSLMISANLLSHGADPSVQHNEENALSLAIKQGSHDRVEQLLSYYTLNINQIINKDGTIIDIANKYGNDKIKQLIQDFKNKQDKKRKIEQMRQQINELEQELKKLNPE